MSMSIGSSEPSGCYRCSSLPAGPSSGSPGNGVTLAALTNSGADQAHALLDRAGIHSRFSSVVSVEKVQRYKPDPAPYRHTLERLGVPADRAAFVAAHAWDILGAERVGIRAVWIASHERAWPLPIRAGENAADAEVAAALLLGEAQ